MSWHSNSHGARPVHLITTMIKWTGTIRLSIKNSLSNTCRYPCNQSTHQSPVPSEIGPKLIITRETRQKSRTSPGNPSEKGTGGCCRGTSLIRNSAPLRPYSRNMSRALQWS